MSSRPAPVRRRQQRLRSSRDLHGLLSIKDGPSGNTVGLAAFCKPAGCIPAWRIASVQVAAVPAYVQGADLLPEGKAGARAMVDRSRSALAGDGDSPARSKTPAPQWPVSSMGSPHAAARSQIASDSRRAATERFQGNRGVQGDAKM